MERTQTRSTARVLIPLALLALGGIAHADSNPQAIVVRLKCGLVGVAGSPDGASASCSSLHHWFAGRLDWVSGGVVLYQEYGPFFGYQADADEVSVFADGNGDPTAFATYYTSPKTSILLAPDLAVRLYVADHNGTYSLATQQPFMPAASALWSKHSEDTFQIEADLKALGDRTHAEEAAMAGAGLFSVVNPDGSAVLNVGGGDGIQVNAHNVQMATGIAGEHHFTNGANSYAGASASLSGALSAGSVSATTGTFTRALSADSLSANNGSFSSALSASTLSASSANVSGALTTSALNATSANVSGPLSANTLNAMSANVSGPLSANTLNASSANVSGALTTSTLNASSGSFSGPLSANALNASSGSFSGPLSANSLNASSANVSGALTTNALNASSASVSGPLSASALSASSAGISGALTTGSLVSTGDVSTGGAFRGSGAGLSNLNGAGLLPGSVPNGALAHSTVGIAAGAGLVGGGAVPLGGNTRLDVSLNLDGTLRGTGGTQPLGLNMGAANTWTVEQTIRPNTPDSPALTIYQPGGTVGGNFDPFDPLFRVTSSDGLSDYLVVNQLGQVVMPNSQGLIAWFINTGNLTVQGDGYIGALNTGSTNATQLTAVTANLGQVAVTQGENVTNGLTVDNLTVTGSIKVANNGGGGGGVVLSACPAGVSAQAISLGYGGMLCVSAPQSTERSVSLDTLLHATIDPTCAAAATFLGSSAVSSLLTAGINYLTAGIDSVINNDLVAPANTALGSTADALTATINGLNATSQGLVSGLNDMISALNSAFGFYNDNHCFKFPLPSPLPNIDFCVGSNLPTFAGFNAAPDVVAPILPTLPNLDLTQYFSGASLVNLAQGAVSDLCPQLIATVEDVLSHFYQTVPHCFPVNGATTCVPENFDPQTSLFASYDDAVDTCALMSAHVCSVEEIYEALHLSPVATQAQGPAGIGFANGEWVLGGQVIADASQIYSQGHVTGDWPPVEADLSKLMNWPPQPPIAFRMPAVPSGQFHCCLSNVHFGQ